MSIFARPVSEIYAPEDPLTIRDVEPTEHHRAWGYTLADVVDADGNNVPPHGTTRVIRVAEGGMTAPVRFEKPEYNATMRIRVVAGSGMLVRAFNTGAPEATILEEAKEEPKEEDKKDREKDKKEYREIVIRPGQALACLNTGSGDLLLYEEVSPVLNPSDEIQLVEPYAKSEPAKPTATTPIFNRTLDGKITGVIRIERSLAPPDGFYDLIDKLAGDHIPAWR